MEAKFGMSRLCYCMAVSGFGTSVSQNSLVTTILRLTHMWTDLHREASFRLPLAESRAGGESGVVSGVEQMVNE